MMQNTKVHIMDHALVKHKIGIIRNKETGKYTFNSIVKELAMLLCYEATRDLPLEDVEIETPICTTTAKQLAGKKLVIVPILRAGEKMAEGVEALIPAAKVGHIGLFRDPETKKPHTYYCKLPPDINERKALIVDPMLATGGSAIDAVAKLKEKDCKDISFLCLIAAPEGLNALTETHPDIEVYIGELDERLNEDCFIVPGLGDAGDRIYGTK